MLLTFLNVFNTSRNGGVLMGGKQTFYTAGIFAKKAGLTLKTIHHYDKEGLLQPSEHNDAGYRLYTDEDFIRLQKILTLKFVGFSLEEIKQLTQSERLESNLKQSLIMQKNIIDEKINHLTLVKKALEEAEDTIKSTNPLDWNRFIDIIKVINLEKVWMKQYKNAANLSTRIHLHDLFSTNKYGWHRWFFDQLKLKPEMRILELGCGDGSLWLRNLERFPMDAQVTLTDISEGMLEDAKKNLSNTAANFQYNTVDAQAIPYEDNNFDIVIANHLLYHVPDRQKAFSEIRRVLKSGGVLYASTIGKKHLIELKELLQQYDPNIIISNSDFSQEFGLETGLAQLSLWFNTVDTIRYEDSLVITEIAPLIDYVLSTTGNTNQILVGDKLRDFKKYLLDKIKLQGNIYISKDTGVLKTQKC